MMTSDRGWALVTGSSGGLGVEFVKTLAARGHNLVLTARSETPMKLLAEDIRRNQGVQVVVEPLDLSMPGAAATLQERLDARGIAIETLVNNAGFGLSDPFFAHDPDRLRDMLQLNVISLTELCWLFGQRMSARGHGRMLLVASLAAYQPSPLLAAYAASKAYVLSLGDALHVELAPKVGVTVISPGPMDTGFNDASGFEPAALLKRFALPPARVAKIGSDAMFAGRSEVVAGGANRVLAFSNRFMSRSLAAKVSFNMSKGTKTGYG